MIRPKFYKAGQTIFTEGKTFLYAFRIARTLEKSPDGLAKAESLMVGFMDGLVSKLNQAKEGA